LTRSQKRIRLQKGSITPVSIIPPSHRFETGPHVRIAFRTDLALKRLDAVDHYANMNAGTAVAVLRAGFERDETAPVCDDCGGYVKTATISFRQAMPVDAMRRAQSETLAADLFIVAGSSLVVYPAAGFPELTKRNGATLVIINREPTGLDHIADLVLNRSIGETLGAAVGTD
jgi:hypothetical protein